MSGQKTVLFLLILITAGISGHRIRILYRLLKAQQRDAGFSLRPLLAHVSAVIVHVLGHKKILRKRAVGIMHLVIFWGFSIIGLGSFELFLRTFSPHLNFEFIGPRAYFLFLFLNDGFTAMVLAAVLYGGYRRVILKPTAPEKSTDAVLILIGIGTLMVSLLLMRSFYILGEQPWYRAALSFSYGLADDLSFFDFTTLTWIKLAQVCKWICLLLVLGFVVYLPYSRFLHILTAKLNVFLMPTALPRGMRLPAPEQDQSHIGAEKVTDLTWKDGLDLYACTECGRCEELCPATNTGKPLSPKRLIMDLKENLFRNEKAILASRPGEIGPLLDGKITEETIWSCSSCRVCEETCPVGISHTDKIYESRRNLVHRQSKIPKEAETLFQNLETYGSPWKMLPEKRREWCEGLSVETIGEAPQADYLLWVGCSGALDERQKTVMRALVRLLKKAKVRFAILGEEEKCTGDAARRLGNEALFQKLARKNIATLNRHQVRKIITACPHCFHTIRNEYKDFGGNFEVIHHSVLLSSLLQEGRLRPTREIAETITLHDSCYLGRWNGIYDELRQILKAIPSARFVEMAQNHEESACCGGGGGLRWLEEKTPMKVNVQRTEQAIHSKCGIIASSCPFCLSRLEDGTRIKSIQDKIQVRDIAEILDQAVIL